MVPETLAIIITASMLSICGVKEVPKEEITPKLEQCSAAFSQCFDTNHTVEAATPCLNKVKKKYNE